MSSRSHLPRNVAVIVVAAVALIVAAALLDHVGLAIAIAILMGGIVLVAVPLVVVHFDEHPDRLGPHGSGHA